MKRFLAAAGLGTIIAWFGLPGSPALACTCDVLPLQAQVESADAVFRGQVLDVTPDGPEQQASVRVLRIYKGDPDPVVDVRTSSSPDTCGIQFGRAAEYLVFARQAATQYTTSLCAGTTDDLGAMERSGFSGHELTVSTPVATTQATEMPKPKPRTLPIAAAAAVLGGVFAVHARRFART